MAIDSEIALALKDMKLEIIEAVKKIIDDSNKKLTTYLKEINTLQFDAIAKDIERHDKYHDEHFEVTKTFDGKITNLRESILKEVDQKLEKINTKSKSNVSTIIAISAVVVSIVAIIVSYR